MPIGLQGHDPIFRLGRMADDLFVDYYGFHQEAVSDVTGLELLGSQLGAGIPSGLKFTYNIAEGDYRSAYRNLFLTTTGIMNLFVTYSAIMAYDRWAFRIGRHSMYEPMSFRDFRFGIGYFMRQIAYRVLPPALALYFLYKHHFDYDIYGWDDPNKRDYTAPPA